jgi:hypothetical protein
MLPGALSDGFRVVSAAFRSPKERSRAAYAPRFLPMASLPGSAGVNLSLW